MDEQSVDTVVIGAGQSGLATAYELVRRGIDFTIVDAGQRIGHVWRSRWASLRLFTPASFNALPGLAFPAHPRSYPGKDQMADYLEAYARHLGLPVRLGVRVTELTRQDGHYLLEAGDLRLVTSRVVVATGAHGRPYIPDFAAALHPAILQLHSASYREPRQVKPGPVLVVGAGNSGVEIALELAAEHDVTLAGPDTGRIPVTLGSLGYRALRHLRTDRWPGRRVAALLANGGDPLVRIGRADLQRAGIRRTGRVCGVRGGRPVVADGRELDVATVIWCTGFHPDYRWIRLPIVDAQGAPIHRNGVVPGEPGLYFVGLPRQLTLASGLVGGAARDAAYVVQALVERTS